MAKSTIRMNRSSSTLPDLNVNWHDQFSVQLVGLALAIVGALLFLSLRSPDTLPWLVAMTGWTSPLLALAVLTVGGVLVLGDRAGYWSVEALVGAELLLLGLQAGSFVWFNPVFQWDMQADGTNGGLVGWVIGGLLVAGFGQSVATVLVGMVIGAGLILLVRYTPLVYVAAVVGRWLRWLAACWLYWSVPRPRRRTKQHQAVAQTPLPRTANFVPAEPVRRARPAVRQVDYDDYGDEEELAPPTRKRRAAQPVAAAPVAPPAPRPVPVSQPPAKSKTRAPKPVARPVTLPSLDLLKPDSGQ